MLIEASTQRGRSETLKGGSEEAARDTDGVGPRSAKRVGAREGGEKRSAG